MTNPQDPPLPDPTAPQPSGDSTPWTAPPPAGGFPPPPPQANPPGGYPPPAPPAAPAGYPQPSYAPQGYPPAGPAQPGGYPPAGYPAGYPAPGPGGFAPPPRKRRKWPWIVAGSVVVVVVALIIVGVVFGRKGSGDPHTAADKFWHALAQHDIKTAQKYVCSGKDLTGDAQFKQLVNALTGYDIGAEAGSGNTRTYPVTLHLSLAGQTGDQVVITTVKKDTGQWYVCDLANQ